MDTATNAIYIDINCDVGEGIGNEAQLLPLISSCNIACGGHAGDGATMREVIKLANKYRVKVGAHPAYPDRANFGRISMDIPEDRLTSSIQDQIQKLVNLLEEEAMDLHHIKAHGALYNDLAKSRSLSRLFLQAMEKYWGSTYLYVPFGSEIAKEALDMGLRIKYEAFADRNYNNDLSLVSRTHAHALIEYPGKVLEHLRRMVTEQTVRTQVGENIHIEADTYCIHGDTPNALQILTYLSKHLPNYQIHIAK